MLLIMVDNASLAKDMMKKSHHHLTIRYDVMTIIYLSHLDRLVQLQTTLGQFEHFGPHRSLLQGLLHVDVRLGDSLHQYVPAVVHLQLDALFERVQESF